MQEEAMDSDMLNVLKAAPILPRSEIYYISRKKPSESDYFYKQSI